MAKKKFVILIGLGVFVLLSAVTIYWFYFSKPAPFPADQQLVEDINSLFPEAEASVIQDTIPVDERHVLVPFISNKNDYGLSYWKWDKYKWKAANIDTNGDPILWKVDKDNPASYQLVWNIHPDDQLGSIDFYLIRDRGYQVTDGIHQYDPRVQMKMEVLMNETSYGAVNLPDEWIEFIHSKKKWSLGKYPGQDFNHELSYGWIPYDRNGQEGYPSRSVNGSAYSNIHIDLRHLMILSPVELEQP